MYSLLFSMGEKKENAAASYRFCEVFRAYKENFNVVFTLVASKCQSYNGTRRDSKA